MTLNADSPDYLADTAHPHARSLDGVGNATLAPGAGELVAVQDNALAGLIVYWSSEGDIELAEFAALWADAGGDPEHLPKAPTASDAIRSTAQRVAMRHHLLARPLKGRSKARKDSGWALVREDGVEGTESPPEGIPVGVGGEDDNAGIGAPISEADVDSTSPLAYEVVAVLKAHPETGTLLVSRATPEVEAELRVGYDYFRTHLTTRGIATWLPLRVLALDGVSIRPSGGVYFIPTPGRAEWERLVRAIRAVSNHRIYAIPAMPAEDTAVAFLDAMEREAVNFAEKAVEDMPDLGAVGRRNRLDAATALIAKIGRYEVLFGEGRLQSARDTLEKLHAAHTIAAIMPLPEAS